MRLLLLALALFAAAPQDGLDRKVAELVQKLTDDSIDARDQAVRGLADLGTAVIPVLQKAMQKLEGEARGRVEEAIATIRSRDTLAQTLPPLKTVTLEHRNRPAREALEEIAKQAGVAVVIAEEVAKEAVSVSLKEATVFEAVDAVCRAHGQLLLQKQLDEQPFGFGGGRPAAKSKLLVVAGAVVPFPTAYVRHYRIRVSEVGLTRVNNFQGTQSTGSLEVGLEWESGVSPRSCIKFEITELRDDKGRSLLPEKKEDDVRGVTLLNRGGWESSTQESVEFKYPESDASKIAVLRGRFVLTYPKEVKTLVFEKPADAKGKALEIHGLKVTLDDYQLKGVEHSIKISTSGKYTGPADPARREGDDNAFDSHLPFSFDDVEPVTESGAILNRNSVGGSGGDEGYTMMMTMTGEKAEALKEIRIPCVLVHHLDEIKFELKDIAFPK